MASGHAGGKNMSLAAVIALMVAGAAVLAVIAISTSDS